MNAELRAARRTKSYGFMYGAATAGFYPWFVPTAEYGGFIILREGRQDYGHIREAVNATKQSVRNHIPGGMWLRADYSQA